MGRFIDIEIRGIDKLTKDLERIGKNVEDIGGKHDVKADDLFTPDFLKRHSRFSSFEELIHEGGFVDRKEPITQERFAAIPDESWNKWIREATDFEDWHDMLNAAGIEYFEKKLFEGIRR